MQKILNEIKFPRKIAVNELENPRQIKESHYQAALRGQDVQVVRLPKTDNATEKVNTALSFQHENVMTFLGYAEDSHTYHVVMPHLQGGSLKNFRLNNKPDLACCIKMAKGITYGLAFLHSRNRVIETFSPEKILLTNHLIPKITGHALQLFKRDTLSVWDDFPTNSDSLTLEQKKTANIRSLGRILLFIFTGRYPEIQSEHYELRMPADIPEKIRGIIFQCLDSFSKEIPKPLDLAEQLESCVQDVALPPISPSAGHNISMPDPHQPGIKIRKATASEQRMIEESYALRPLENYNIDNIEVFENLATFRVFHAHCENLQSRANSETLDYRSKWLKHPEAKQRQESLQAFQGYASRYRVTKYPDINILPLWHGAPIEAVNSIFSNSLAIRFSRNGTKFGSGVYLSPQADYVAQYYASKKDERIVLIFSLVATYSIYPVQKSDSLQGAAMKPRYDAHVIQVTDEEHPREFDVCPSGQNPKYMEVVVSQEAACYPFAKVTLQYSPEKTDLISFTPLIYNPVISPRQQLLDYLSIYASSNLLDFGEYIVSGHRDGRLKIWHTNTAACKIWPIHQHSIVKLELKSNCIIAQDEKGHAIVEKMSYYDIHSNRILKDPFKEVSTKYPAIKNHQLKMANKIVPTDEINFKPMVIDPNDLKALNQCAPIAQSEGNRWDYMVPMFSTERVSFYGSMLARKIYKSSQITAPSSYLMRNFQKMPYLHPNLVSIHGLSEDKKNTFVLIPYFEKGTLENYLARESNEISDSQKIEWMIQIAAGLNILHKNGMVDNHLTLRQILVRPDGSVAIGSFGDAGTSDSAASAAGANGEKSNDEAENVSFRAKETFERKYALLKNDERLIARKNAEIFSFLLICHAILLRKRPLEYSENVAGIFKLALTGQPRFPVATLDPWKNSDWGKLLRDLILQCTDPKVSDRPSIDVVCKKLVDIQNKFNQEIKVLPLCKQAPKRWTQSQKFVETSTALWPEEKALMAFCLAFQNKSKVEIVSIEAIISSKRAEAFRSRQQIQEMRKQAASYAFRESWLSYSDPFAHQRHIQKAYFQEIIAIAARDFENPNLIFQRLEPQEMVRPIPFWLIVDESEVNRVLHGDFPITNARYGRGVYGSLECNPVKGKVAIFCAANIRAPYPILPQDPDFTGKRNYDNSDAHIVLHKGKSTVVLFETKDIEPRYILRLEKTEESIPDKFKEPWLEVENVSFLPASHESSIMMQPVISLLGFAEKQSEPTPLKPAFFGSPGIPAVEPEIQPNILDNPKDSEGIKASSSNQPQEFRKSAFFSQPKENLKTEEWVQTIELGRQFIVGIAHDKPNTFKVMNCYSAEEIFIEAHKKPILGIRIVNEETFVSYSEDEEKTWESTEYGPREKLEMALQRLSPTFCS